MTTARPQSIRRRVTVTAVLLLGLLSAALLTSAWRSASHAADEAFDRVVGASALSIADNLRISDGRIAVEIPQAALAMIGLKSRSRVFYRIVDATGNLIAGSVTLGLDLAPATGPDPVFSTGSFRGTPVRFAMAGRYIDRGWVSVIVAETLESRSELAWRLFFPSLAAVSIVFLIAIALVVAGLRRAFRPLAVIEEELRLRAPTDLTAIASPAPREVGGLVGALDDFMQRLQGTLDRVQNYASHAAHEVRTPIAVIRAQAAAALSETDLSAARQRLRRIEANAVAAGQIVNQMLLDATVQHRIGTQTAMNVDLTALCGEVIDRLDPLLQPAVRLEFQGRDGEAALIKGDPVAVREAIRNLVDNALKYAPSGLVTIVVAPTADGWRVDVADCGPGIPDDSMVRMTERFARGEAASGVAGAGLGLHIVRQVAEAYGGLLELANRPEGGLSARLTFRRAAAALVALIVATVAQPAEAQPAQAVELRLLGSIDRGLIDPLVQGFRQVRPDVKVMLEHVDSQLALTRVQSEAAVGAGPDLVIGHAADILVEMVNDGYAGTGLAPLALLAPEWAGWRSEVFAFALDHGAFVYRRAAFTDEAMPRNRAELMRLLDRLGDRFRGRVGTLDVGNNSVAHLLASQEARLSTSYWRLIRTLGAVEARIYWNTQDMSDAFRRGEIDIAYNAIASELGDLGGDDRFAIVEPDDFRLAFPRAAFVPRQSRSPNVALAFMRFLLSPEGQSIVARAGGQPVIEASQPLAQRPGPPLQRVALGPGLLALRDLHTRSTLMETWLQLIISK